VIKDLTLRDVRAALDELNRRLRALEDEVKALKARVTELES